MKTLIPLVFISTCIILCISSCGDVKKEPKQIATKAKTSINKNSSQSKNTLDDDKLVLALRKLYNSDTVNMAGDIDFSAFANELRKEFHILNKQDLKDADNKVTKNYDGGVVSQSEIAELFKNSYNRRKQTYNLKKNELGEWTSGYRHPEGQAYKLEKSVYFSWSEILDWMFEVRNDYGFEDSELGLRVYFGQYSENPSDSKLKLRSTIFLRALDLTKSPPQILKEQGQNEKPNYNLGELCPPSCNQILEDIYTDDDTSNP